jgi:hypothetical protein
MSNSHRLSIFKELGYYFRGYKIRKQTGKHKDYREKTNTFLCSPVGICKYYYGEQIKCSFVNCNENQLYPVLFLEAFQFYAVMLLGFSFLGSVKTTINHCLSKLKCRKNDFNV